MVTAQQTLVLVDLARGARRRCRTTSEPRRALENGDLEE